MESCTDSRTAGSSVRSAVKRNAVDCPCWIVLRVLSLVRVNVTVFHWTNHAIRVADQLLIRSIRSDEATFFAVVPSFTISVIVSRITSFEYLLMIEGVVISSIHNVFVPLLRIVFICMPFRWETNCTVPIPTGAIVTVVNVLCPTVHVFCTFVLVIAHCAWIP